MLVLPADFVGCAATLGPALVGLILGEAIRIWGVGYAGSSTRTRGDAVSELVVAGPFRYLRNPLYVGNILLYTACAVLFGFLYLSIAVFVFSYLQYSFIIAYEEELLERKFGEQYRQYKARVPRWFPTLSPCPSQSRHVFDLKRAVRSERSTLMALAGVGIALSIKR